MPKHCPANERIKRDYLEFLQHAKRYSEPSIDGVTKAIARFEGYTGNKDFKKFHIQQAIGFKKQLAGETRASKGEALSLATQRSTLNSLRALFVWLASRPGYKSKFSYADADYFNLSDKDNRAAQKHTARPFPSIEQVQLVIRSMPSATAIEQRNRALIAFVLMTASRDRALVSLKLKHIDLATSCVTFDAREVKTKFSKSFDTFFLPVGDDIRTILHDWVATLVKDHLWGPTDPLFPKTLMLLNGAEGFRAIGLQREHWTTANAVRRIFKDAFEAAGLTYFHPHSIRHTLVRFGVQTCKGPEEFKAFSQNIGHDHVMTTFKNYGNVSPARQAELMRELGTATATTQGNLADLLRQAATEVEAKRSSKS
jgi:integrase